MNGLIAAFSNPYHGLTFFSFFVTFFTRMGAFLTGQLRVAELASDEVQIMVLITISASAALVGCFLVLRRMTMLANSLSHTILMGIVFAYLATQGMGHSDEFHGSFTISIEAMLVASLGMGFITTFLTEFLTKKGGLKEDASTALVFTSLFALGIILVTLLTRNSHIGTEAVMGNVDALHTDDLKMGVLVLAANIFLILLFFKEFKMTTFDPQLAVALGFSTTFFNYLLMAQTSATVIGAFRAVGVLLVLSFITAPPLTARLVCNSLKGMLIGAMVVSSLASLIGVALTRHLLTVCDIALSTSGVVVCTLAFFYCATLGYSMFINSPKFFKAK